VLDDGRLTDNKGRVVNFKNTIIVMTSNIGSHIIQERFEKMTEKNADEVQEATKAEVFELLKTSMRPEFLNRIDDIIMFTPLTKKHVREIVNLQLEFIRKKLAERNINMTATDFALDSIADMGYDPQFGARPIKRVIQKNILNELSKQILAGTVHPDSDILLDSFDGKFVFRNPKEKVKTK